MRACRLLAAKATPAARGDEAPITTTSPDKSSGYELRPYRRTACTNCRFLRKKCDGQRPKCGRCTSTDRDCKFDEPDDNRLPARRPNPEMASLRTDQNMAKTTKNGGLAKSSKKSGSSRADKPGGKSSLLRGILPPLHQGQAMSNETESPPDLRLGTWVMTNRGLVRI